MSGNEFGAFITEAVKSVHGFDSVPLYRPGNDVTYLDVAIRHHIIFCLNSYLKRSKSLSTSSLTCLIESRAVMEASHQLRVQHTLALIYKTLGGNGINFLLYKGLALQARFYEGQQRLSGDIDIIVDPKLVCEAVKSLVAVGGLPNRSEDTSSGVSILNFGGIILEIHSVLVEPHIAHLPYSQELIKDRQTITLDCGITLWTLGDLSHLLALLVHGFKHQWCRLLWVLDIALILRKLGTKALPALMEQARINNVGRIAVVGIALAVEIFSVEISLPRLTVVEQCLVRFYQYRMFECGDGIAFKINNFGLHLAGIEGHRRRLLYFRGRGNRKLQTASTT